jgi:hypothetical protein
VSFWTFSEDFLAGLSDEEKLSHLQKSSFRFQHVANFLGSSPDTDKRAIVEMTVACLNFSELADQYVQSSDIDLLVLDCEGYEAVLIPGIDFHHINPRAIFYESHNLGDSETAVGAFLASNGYQVFQLGGDAFAIKAEFLALWQRTNPQVSRYLTHPPCYNKTIAASASLAQEISL